MNTKTLFTLLSKLDTEHDTVIQWQKELTARPALAPEYFGQGEGNKAQWIIQELESLHTPIIKVCYTEDERVSSGSRPNILAFFPGEREETLWIVTHMDVAPTGDRSLWNTQPFSVHVDGDFLYGRGVEDNQQAIVSALLTAKLLQESPIKPYYSLGLLFSSDEETGMKFGLPSIMKQGQHPFSKHDFIIVPDLGNSDGTDIFVSEKNLLWFKFTISNLPKTNSSLSAPDLHSISAVSSASTTSSTTTVRSASTANSTSTVSALSTLKSLLTLHSTSLTSSPSSLTSRPSEDSLSASSDTQALNEIVEHCKIELLKLSQYFTQSDPLFTPEQSTFRIYDESSNSDLSQAKDAQSFFFDCRLLPSYDPNALIGLCERLVSDINANYAFKVESELMYSLTNPFSCSATTPVVSLLQNTLWQVHKKKGQIRGSSNQSLASYIRNLGVPAIAWATLEPNPHVPNERSSISKTIADAKVFFAMLYPSLKK